MGEVGGGRELQSWQPDGYWRWLLTANPRIDTVGGVWDFFFKTRGQGWEANLLGLQAGVGGKERLKRGEGLTEEQSFKWALICKDKAMNTYRKRERWIKFNIWRCNTQLNRKWRWRRNQFVKGTVCTELSGPLAWVQGRRFIRDRVQRPYMPPKVWGRGISSF